MNGGTTTFSRRLDRPLAECLGALEAWSRGAAARRAVPTGPDVGAPPARYRVAVSTGPLRRRTPVEVRVGPWAGTGSTHLELVPARANRPTTRFFAGARCLLDELTAVAGAKEPATAPIMSDATTSGRSRLGWWAT